MSDLVFCERCQTQLVWCRRSGGEVLVCLCCDEAFQKPGSKDNCPHKGD